MKCKKCNDTGWIVTDEVNGLKFKEPCECLDRTKPLWQPLEES